jgi:arylsulfatase
MDKLRALGLDKSTLVFYTTDNGAWQDVYPDAGYTPFRGTKGTVREGGNRVPAIAVWPDKIKPGTKNHDIVGGLDFMAVYLGLSLWSTNVHYWHFADIDADDEHVCFWG